MICRYCKTENSYGATMCANCGASMDHGPVEVLNKKRYLKEEAPAAAKNAARMVSILLIVSVILLAVSGMITMFGAVYEIPFISTLASIADADVDELEDMFDELEEEADAYEELVELMEDDLSKNELKVATNFAKKAQSVAKTPSIVNINSMISYTEKNSDDIEDIFGDGAVDGAEELGEIFGTILTVLYIFGGICILFTVLGGLSKNTGLVVTGMIFSVLYGFVFGGILMVILTFLAQLLLAMQCSKVNKAYKKYRADIMA